MRQRPHELMIAAIRLQITIDKGEHLIASAQGFAIHSNRRCAIGAHDLRIDAIERGLTVLAIAYGVTTLRISGEYVEEQLKGMGRK